MKTITCDDLIDRLKVDYTSFKEEEILVQLRKDEEIVVYCTDHICNRSIVMYYQLEDLGYKNVFRYPGGIREWANNGQELEDISASWNLKNR